MRRVVGQSSKQFRILSWSEDSGIGSSIEFRDTFSALAFLRTLKTDFDCMMSLRQVLASKDGSIKIASLRDHQVLEQLAWRMVSRQVRLAEEDRPATSGAARQTEPVAYEEKRRDERSENRTLTQPSPPPKTTEIKTWIEIKLIGEDNQPIPFARYVIERSNGTVVDKGRLDADGFTYKDDLEDDAYSVSFPEFDQEAWEKIS